MKDHPKYSPFEYIKWERNFLRQPNEQAQIVAHRLPLTSIIAISSSQDFKGMLIDRYLGLNWNQFFSSFYHLSNLVSAYRDKLERYHGYSNKCDNDSNW